MRVTIRPKQHDGGQQRQRQGEGGLDGGRGNRGEGDREPGTAPQGQSEIPYQRAESISDVLKVSFADGILKGTIDAASACIKVYSSTRAPQKWIIAFACVPPLREEDRSERPEVFGHRWVPPEHTQLQEPQGGTDLLHQGRKLHNEYGLLHWQPVQGCYRDGPAGRPEGSHDPTGYPQAQGYGDLRKQDQAAPTRPEEAAREEEELLQYGGLRRGEPTCLGQEQGFDTDWLDGIWEDPAS